MTFETAAFSIAAVMCGVLGEIQLAAYQIIIITGTLGFCIYYSIGAAVSVRVAFAKGREDNSAMRRSAWAGYHILLIIMCLSSLTFVIFGEDIMSAFTEDRAVLLCATSLIPPLVLYQLGDATQINFASALRGTANVKPMLWIAFFSYILIGIPATYALCFPLKFGLYGIVLSFSVSLFTAAALFLYNFLRSTR
jgi:MATE family multidrug resistance protein